MAEDTERGRKRNTYLYHQSLVQVWKSEISENDTAIDVIVFPSYMQRSLPIQDYGKIHER